jgi:hypothetical protein
VRDDTAPSPLYLPDPESGIWRPVDPNGPEAETIRNSAGYRALVQREMAANHGLDLTEAGS